MPLQLAFPRMPVLAPGAITGLVLAGGRGSRMGGLDKGLQDFDGLPLALRALMRLAPQVGGVVLNANRNLAAYEAFGAPVWPDTLDGQTGPLAGFLTGLQRCATPCLVTVPCDTPLFPPDLVARLADALVREEADITMAAGLETSGPGGSGPPGVSGAGGMAGAAGMPPVLRAQPVFCLLRVGLLESLTRFVQAGGRKIEAWTAQHRTVLVPFDAPGDDPRAFRNVNTLAELRALEQQA